MHRQHCFEEWPKKISLEPLGFFIIRRPQAYR
jgi:hypothetical protein